MMNTKFSKSWMSVIKDIVTVSIFGLFFVMSFADCYADQQNVASKAGGSFFNRDWMGYVPIVLVFTVFYFLVIRPQNKKRKALEEMIHSMKEGDCVITNGGMIGTVTENDHKERYILLEISKNVKVKILRSAIAKVGESPQ
ncbi:preprotein translocase subunit YajC [Candidatus Sneabacter namystus]|uniref:Sec translocon accessory complex subunit YajC n=1 Tax=Candidatus Sneabacter namystus TaxID=2601646 RepID=A0A5C0UJG6_9RICK|nr:preprotein translocase subunit YajC [Candidatus Sneabacter namystus]QEK39612.1 preprotein translocase subunit YajC [Candidatus Sneabacter namystus]